MSILTVNVGGMFSGKSTELQRQGERHVLAGHKVLFIKPDMDTRYSDCEVVTHKGQKVKAISVPTYADLKNYINTAEVDVVLIDEVQFFSERIIPSIWWLLSKGIKVYASGLDMDFLSDGFPTTEKLMAMADVVQKFHAVCEGCGEDAVITAKRNFHEVGSSDVIELGAKETYIPLCRSCYIKYMATKGEDSNG